MNIATALNRKYVGYTSVMLLSLCENNKDEPIHAFLLNHELTDTDIEELRKAVEVYDIEITPVFIDRSCFDDRIAHNDKWSMEAYYRLMLFDLLPESVERLLYLDVDMIVNKNISEFYHRDFADKRIFACVNTGGYIDAMDRFNDRQKRMFAPIFEKGYQYFNSGMLLLDVKNLRREYRFDDYLRAMEDWDYEMVAPDQDLLNYLHYDRVGYVEAETYNYFSRIAHEQGYDYEKGKKELTIIHFTDEKPWETKNYHYPLEKLWWEYAKKSIFYQRMLEGFLERTLTDPKIENWIRDLMQQVEDVNAKFGQSLELINKLMGMVKNQGET